MEISQFEKTQEIYMLIEDIITREDEVQVMQIIITAICTKQINQRYFRHLVKTWSAKCASNKNNINNN
jgi:hypothetical protein